jgi:hypothetical protein
VIALERPSLNQPCRRHDPAHVARACEHVHCGPVSSKIPHLDQAALDLPAGPDPVSSMIVGVGVGGLTVGASCGGLLAGLDHEELAHHAAVLVLEDVAMEHVGL